MRHPVLNRPRGGFTLTELLVVLGVIGILAAVVLVAVKPFEHLGAATDAGRAQSAKELQKAQFQYLIDHGAYAADKQIPEGKQNAAPICRWGRTDTGCVSMDDLVPTFLPCLPYDGAEPNPAYSGYRIHLEVGRVRVTALYVGSGATRGGCDAFAILTDGLVGYWTFDEVSGTGATDWVTSREEGTYTNGPTPSTDTAPVAFSNPRSRAFDGIDDCVTIPSLFGEPGSITLSLWVKLGGGEDTGELISVANSASIRLEGGLLKGFFFDGGGWKFTNNGYPLGDTAWHHVTYVYGGPGFQRLYVDGVERDSSGWLDAISYGGGLDGTYIGGFCGGGRDFRGSLDDVRVYDRALSPSEVAEIAAGNR